MASIEYPNGYSEFEVQAFLLYRLRELGYRIRGHATANSLILDLVIFDEDGDSKRIIETKRSRASLNKTQITKYRQFKVPIDVIKGMRHAEQYVTHVENFGLPVIEVRPQKAESPQDRKGVAGQSFGMLTAVRPGPSLPEGTRLRSSWVCLCDCGQEVVVLTRKLVRGLKRSCGCACKFPVKRLTEKEANRNLRDRNRRQSETPRTPLMEKAIQAWRRLPQKYPQHFSDKPEWDEFIEKCGLPQNMQQWLIVADKSQAPSLKNLKWGAPADAYSHRRRLEATDVTIRGETKTAKEWAENSPVDAKTIVLRIKRGWSAENAVATKQRHKNPDSTSRPGPKPTPIVGHRSGKLTVISCDNGMAKVKCDCGNTTSIRKDNFRSGRTKSCGCLRGRPRKTPVDQK